MHVHVLNIYIYIYTCIQHTPAQTHKPLCASCVVQSAAMAQWLQSAAQSWAMRNVHEVGDIVHHWQTGRGGTVTAVHPDGHQIYIKFDLFNPDGWKYGNDGWSELRRKDCFIVRMKRSAPTNDDVDLVAAKRGRLQ